MQKATINHICFRCKKTYLAYMSVTDGTNTVPTNGYYYCHGCDYRCSAGDYEVNKITFALVGD